MQKGMTVGIYRWVTILILVYGVYASASKFGPTLRGIGLEGSQTDVADSFPLEFLDVTGTEPDSKDECEAMKRLKKQWNLHSPEKCDCTPKNLWDSHQKNQFVCEEISVALGNIFDNFGGFGDGGDLESKSMHVVGIKFVKTGLAGDNLDDLLYFSQLRFLYLGNNKLEGSIPSTLFQNLTKLTKVKLENNRLSGVLPTETTKHQSNSLEEFDVSQNDLEGNLFNKELHALKILDVRSNKLSGTIQLEKMESLIKVLLGQNNFDTFPTITAEYAKKSKMKLLDLSYNKGLEGALPEELKDMKHLEILRVQETGLHGSIILPPNLSVGVFFHNNFSDIAGVLPSSLEELYLNCGNKEEKMIKLREIPGDQFPQNMTILEAANCDLTKIPEWGKALKTLERIDLSYNRLAELPSFSYRKKVNVSNSDVDIYHSGLFELMGNLTHLDISGNDLRQVYGEYFPKSLKYLDVSHNKYLQKMPQIEFGIDYSKLQVLRLNNCKLRELPFERLEDHRLHDLQLMDISHNKFSSWRDVQELVEFSSSLEILNAGYNELKWDRPKSEFLFERVSYNSLKQLWLQRNMFDGPVPDMREYKSLTLLNLLESGFQDKKLEEGWLKRSENITIYYKTYKCPSLEPNDDSREVTLNVLADWGQDYQKFQNCECLPNFYGNITLAPNKCIQCPQNAECPGHPVCVRASEFSGDINRNPYMASDTGNVCKKHVYTDAYDDGDTWLLYLGPLPKREEGYWARLSDIGQCSHGHPKNDEKVSNAFQKCTRVQTKNNVCAPLPEEKSGENILYGDIWEYRSCKKGYTGRKCSQCENGYFLFGNTCTHCPNQAIITVIIFFAILVMVLLYSSLFVSRRRDSGRLPLPTKMLGVFEGTAGFMFDVTTIECINEGFNFMARFWVALSMIPIAGAMTFLIFNVVSGIRRWQNVVVAHNTEKFNLKCLNVFIFFMYIIYLKVASMAMFALNITDVDTCTGERYFLADAAQRYDTASGMAMYALAWIVVATFVIGFPLLIAFNLLISFKEGSLNDAMTLKVYGFVYECYEKKFWWWEGVVLLRKLAILVAISAVHVSWDNVTVPFVIFLILLLSVVIQRNYSPYVDPTDNVLEYLSLLVLAGNFAASIIYFVPNVGKLGDVIAWLVIILDILMLCLLIILFFAKNLKKQTLLEAWEKFVIILSGPRSVGFVFEDSEAFGVYMTTNPGTKTFKDSEEQCVSDEPLATKARSRSSVGPVFYDEIDDNLGENAPLIE